MPLARDARASGVHLFYAGAKKHSVQSRGLHGFAGLKRILGYFAKIILFSKLFLRQLEGPYLLHQVQVQLNLHRTSRDLQVFKFAAHQAESALHIPRLVFGIETRYEAVCRDDVQEI